VTDPKTVGNLIPPAASEKLRLILGRVHPRPTREELLTEVLAPIRSELEAHAILPEWLAYELAELFGLAD
jgi:hypothetical protein